ncbi:MAG: hypothetical protein E7045_04460 [Lentisphaerae bacterium]|nr:hypothetical protein [Lentisphaerota bacterium]
MPLIIKPVESSEMYPLTGNIGDFPVAASTVGSLISGRFPAAMARTVIVRADFVPSPELAAQLAGAVPMVVTDPEDGTLLAEVESSETIKVKPDAGSVRLRYPWDLLRLNEVAVSAVKADEISGDISERAVVNGKIVLGENSTILPGVYIEGNVIIGRNCKIGPNCYIRGNTSIGDNCRIGQSVEIKNCIIADHTAISHLSYAGDSIIASHVNFGAGTIISNFRHDGANHRYMVNGKLIDTGRTKFGAVIGKNVHTGINTSIYPGRYLSQGIQLLPGEIVKNSR